MPKSVNHVCTVELRPCKVYQHLLAPYSSADNCVYIEFLHPHPLRATQ